ncbi:hypothetical protein [Rummeliibacillus stabekisii]|uniref:hypothetical protein n=1 Tax=Rummeliibacillus stabekisii TaxID=241244 RepID=UPI001169B722|nr:hypothetical protein [Rummeliibacillus stabekisii]MBB5171731.1 hypothetical protein [Rummeliibacillus stabekisii]GEL06336.1 hypothetical protein RST01_29630 [Rummeliibacillus stabekisii]
MVDNLFEYLNTYSKFNHLKDFTKKVDFDNLEKEISNYQKVLNYCKKKIQTTTKGQNYTRRFPLDDIHHYSISWDIEKAKEIIVNNKIPVCDMKVNDLWGNVSKEHLDFDYINNTLTYDQSEPIIVVFYAPLNALIPIDGNHRLAKQYYRNKNGKISAYLLEPDEHTQAMCGEYYRVLYKINHNLQVINNYVLGNIKAYEYTNNYIPNKGAMLIYKFNIIKYKILSFIN